MLYFYRRIGTWPSGFFTPPLPAPQKPSQYERIVSVLREFPEVRNIRAVAEALNEELSK